MEYIITNESLRAVEIESDDKSVLFIIRKDDNKLLQLNVRDNVGEVFVPHIFPSGHKIESTTYGFLNGNPSRVVFADEIQIEENSFCSNRLFNGEVVWPSYCKIIPHHCFYNSGVTKVTNIEKVMTVKDDAFSCSAITEIHWPDGCKTIPEFCFANCRNLQRIEMQNVEEILSSAFYNAGIKEIKWPTKCKVIPNYCFASSRLQKIEGLKDVKLIEASAFCNTNLDCLDLSEADGIFLEAGALRFLSNQCKLILPYYISEDSLEDAFD